MNPSVSLCERCTHLRIVASGKGSRFLLCRLSHIDRRYPKYPPQPVRSCAGFAAPPATSADGKTGDEGC